MSPERYHSLVRKLPFTDGATETWDATIRARMEEAVSAAFGQYGGRLLNAWEVVWSGWPLWFLEILVNSREVFEDMKHENVIADKINWEVDNDYGHTIMVGDDDVPGGVIMRFLMSPYPF